MKKICVTVFGLIPTLVTGAAAQDKATVSYEEFVQKISAALPELKSNEIDLLSAENTVKSAKSAGDTKFTADGQYSSVNQYSGADVGKVNGSEYSAGLAKKIVTTGTEISTTAAYETNSYRGFNGSSEYSTYTPSVALKVAQPVMYNFLGKVDRFSEKDARLKADIAKITLSENNKSAVTAYRKAYFQWIMYREIIDSLDLVIQNAKRQRDQTARNARTGLSEDDDYQLTVSSLLSYEAQKRNYETSENTLEKELGVYLDVTRLQPDRIVFYDYSGTAAAFKFAFVDFDKTDSAKIIKLTLERLAYSKGVSENRMLPELDLFAQIAQKNMTSSSSEKFSSMPYRDYSVGFEFTYNIENNSAAAELESVNLEIRSMQLARESTQNAYQKRLLGVIENAEGCKTLLENYARNVDALKRRLSAEKRKYAQGRIQLSDIIDTENSIASKNIDIISLRYQIIANYIDYLDMTR